MDDKFIFKDYYFRRKLFLNENKDKDFVYNKTQSRILLSCPHGVPQTRLGFSKYAEIGALAVTLELAEKLNTNMIAKTSNNFDDANFDEVSPYKNKIKKELDNLSYIIDFHGLASRREMDVNLGTNFGRNVSANPKLFQKLARALRNAGLIVTVDNPFSGGNRTISGTFGNDLWTVQIEINSSITNDRVQHKKLELLLETLTTWLKQLD